MSEQKGSVFPQFSFLLLKNIENDSSIFMVNYLVQKCNSVKYIVFPAEY